MLRSDAVLTVGVIALILITGAFACNSGTSTPNNATSQTNSQTPVPDKAPAGIDGKYAVTGSNPDGKGAYTADLEVIPHGDVYQFKWHSGNNAYDGVGVMTDREVAVAYSDSGVGKGCGVVLYKIGSDHSLNGKVGYWGTDSMEKETATRTEGSGDALDGSYKIKGTNPDGKQYEGSLKVAKDGDGYTFDWDAGDSFSGYGIRADEYVAVGFGGKPCSFVGYDVKADGTLQGKWGSQGFKSFGTEVAKKK